MARPNLSYLKSLILLLVGLPLGMLTGLTAIAASVFALPAVRVLLGLRPERAAGVGLAVTFAAAAGALLSYGQHSALPVGLALLLAACSVVGAAWGTRLSARFPHAGRLDWLWGTLTAAGGLAMLAQGLGLLGHAPPWHTPFVAQPLLYAEAVPLALAVGVFSRLIGLGGVLLVPALIYGLGMSPRPAQGAAILVLALASLPGLLIHARRGAVEPQAATWLSAGAVFGGLAGAYWANTALSDARLLALFGGALTAAGLTLLWRRDGAEA